MQGIWFQGRGDGDDPYTLVDISRFSAKWFVSKGGEWVKASEYDSNLAYADNQPLIR
ncbi:MAG: hypothetical protein LBQ52_05565 [Helicobacteraceae bacterium]|jgi:hypothetical protein|nr:hypothetical protein [Helicobacteraceae bacterium]